MILTEISFAKINLHLEVLSKRTDGYHNIFSLMVPIDLFDKIYFNKVELLSDSTVPLDVRILSAGGQNEQLIDNIPVEDNLITKAVKAYFKNSGDSIRLEVSVEKNIPAGAGLAGGSSNAAAILRFLNKNYLKYSRSQLLDIAASVGADVPFCLLSEPAFCQGIGEILTPVDIINKYYVVLVNNGIHVNTAEAYEKIKDFKEFKMYDASEFSLKKKDILTALNERVLDEKQFLFINDFEFPVFNLYPELKLLKEKMYSYKADLALMTGSGSSVIGIFSDKDFADQALKGFSDIVQQVHMASFGGNL